MTELREEFLAGGFYEDIGREVKRLLASLPPASRFRTSEVIRLMLFLASYDVMGQQMSGRAESWSRRQKRWLDVRRDYRALNEAEQNVAWEALWLMKSMATAIGNGLRAAETTALREMIAAGGDKAKWAQREIESDSRYEDMFEDEPPALSVIDGGKVEP